MKTLQEVLNGMTLNLTSELSDSVLEVANYKHVDCDQLNDEGDLYDCLDDSGSLHESIDSHIDIYYHDLRKWAVDNFNYIDDAIDEGLTEGNDFHELIQSGQYMYYREAMSEAVSELWHAISDEVFKAQDEESEDEY